MTPKFPTFQVRPGTMDEAFAEGRILRHPNPETVEGIVLAEEWIGDAAQEVWECWSDVAQRKSYMLIGGAFGAVVGAAIALLVTATHGPPQSFVLVLVLAAAGAVFGRRHAQGQNRADELMGHAVSAVASMRYEGMTDARAKQCFEGNLGSYSTMEGLSEVELERRWRADFPAAGQWLDAHPEVIAALQEIKAKAYPPPPSAEG